MNEKAQPEQLEIIFAKGTDIGRTRNHNEDYLDAFSPPDPVQRQQKGDLFIVADGMGGHQAGDIASQTAVTIISHEYYADPNTDVQASLTSAIEKANAYIYQDAAQNINRAGMGTTVVAAVIRGRELYLANVGDSRAYLMRQGKVTQVTRDHSFVAEQVRAGLLTLEQARAHPQRNVITRALGSRPEVQVDTYAYELQPGDMLLLCTDGLSEYVREDDLLTILSQYSPEEAVPRLIALANRRGGADNISAIVIQAGPRPGPARTQPLTAPTQRIAVQPRRRPIWPWALGIMLGAALAVGLILGGIVVLPPLLRRMQATASPEIAPSPVTSTPESSSSAPSQTATVTPTVNPAPTPITVDFWEPADGAIVPPGPVEFRWRVPGLSPFTHIVVQSRSMEFCRTTQQSCQVILTTEGDYTWWIELIVNGVKVYETPPRVLHVRSSAESPAITPTPAPTQTIAPPSGSNVGTAESTPQ